MPPVLQRSSSGRKSRRPRCPVGYCTTAQGLPCSLLSRARLGRTWQNVTVHWSVTLMMRMMMIPKAASGCFWRNLSNQSPAYDIIQDSLHHSKVFYSCHPLTLHRMFFSIKSSVVPVATKGLYSYIETIHVYETNDGRHRNSSILRTGQVVIFCGEGKSKREELI